MWTSTNGERTLEWHPNLGGQSRLGTRSVAPVIIADLCAGEAALLAGYECMVGVLAPATEPHRDTLRRLAQLYADWGRDTEAGAFRERLAAASVGP